MSRARLFQGSPPALVVAVLSLPLGWTAFAARPVAGAEPKATPDVSPPAGEGAEGLRRALESELQDADRRVRIAAAEALFQWCEQQRADPRVDAARQFASILGQKPIFSVEGALRQLWAKSKSAEAPEGSFDEWLEQFYAGQGQPPWLRLLITPLEKMVSADIAEERLAGAMALAPLGRGDRAVPVLLACARSDPRLMETVGKVLPWLVWEKRREAFRQFLALAKGSSDLGCLISGLAASPDRRAADTFWQLLDEPKMTDELAAILLEGLREAYFGQSRGNWDGPGKGPAAARKDAAQAAKLRVSQGSEQVRLVAMALLAGAAPEEAAEAAAGIASDPKAGPRLRTSAFQVLLVTRPIAAANRAALEAISQDDLQRKKTALSYLVEGRDRLLTLRDHFRLQLHDSETPPGKQSGIPRSPKGLKREQLRPLLTSSDPESAAYAGYVMVLLGHAEGLPPLLRYWQRDGGKTSGMDRLVYTAIAALDDSSQLAVLRQIYDKLPEREIRDFYWTIRVPGHDRSGSPAIPQGDPRSGWHGEPPLGTFTRENG